MSQRPSIGLSAQKNLCLFNKDTQQDWKWKAFLRRGTFLSVPIQVVETVINTRRASQPQPKQAIKYEGYFMESN